MIPGLAALLDRQVVGEIVVALAVSALVADRLLRLGGHAFTTARMMGVDAALTALLVPILPPRLTG